MKVDVPVSLYSGEIMIYSGKIVDVAPNVANVASFIVSKSVWGTWVVTNIETGLSVGGERHRTKASAIAAAAEQCKDKSEADFLVAFKKKRIDIEKLYKVNGWRENDK